MSWIESIKGFFSEEKPKEKVNEIPFEDIPFKVKEKRESLLSSGESLKKALELKVKELHLAQIIENLENVDITGKKEQEKIKHIVKENLALYTFYLKKLSTDLHSLQSRDKDYINKIFALLEEFDRSSVLSFEKATILVGKELEAAKNSLQSFYRSVKSIRENHSSLFETLKASDKISLLFDDLNENNSYCKESLSQVNILNKDLLLAKEERSRLEQKIFEIKSGTEYKKDMQLKDAYQEKLSQAEKELASIKEKINFKLLANHFHFDKKKHALIQSYSSSFKSALKDDSQHQIIELVKSAQNIDISSLSSLAEQISPSELMTKSDELISNFESEIAFSLSRASNLEIKIKEEQKKLSKLSAKKEDIVNQIKTLSNSLLRQ